MPGNKISAISVHKQQRYSVSHLTSCDPLDVSPTVVKRMYKHGLNLNFIFCNLGFPGKREDFSRLRAFLNNLASVEIAVRKQESARGALMDRDNCINRLSAATVTYSTLVMTYKALEREGLLGILINSVMGSDIKPEAVKGPVLLLSFLERKFSVHTHCFSKFTGVIKNLAKVNTAERVFCCEAYLLPLLGYLLEEFLKNSIALSQFPLYLFNCATVEEFARKFEDAVVPRMLWYTTKGKKSDEVLKCLAALLDKSGTQVVADNYATLAAFYLPAVSASNLNPELVEDKNLLAKSSSLLHLVERTLGEDRCNRYLMDHMPEIFACVLKHVSADSAFTENGGNSSLHIIKQALPSTTQKLAMAMIRYIE